MRLPRPVGVLLFALFLGPVAVMAAPTNKPPEVPKTKWFQNGKGYADALALQKQTGADIFVYFARYQESEKGLCTWWEKKGMQHPDVEKLLRDFIKVKFTFPLNRDDQALADKWKVNKCPTVFVVQTNGWHGRCMVFDWPGGNPKLKSPEELTSSIIEAAISGSSRRKGGGAPARAADPAAPAVRKE